jgi:DNA-binding NarL/FixJ family response regulator
MAPSRPMITRVIIADDHQLVRAGIASLLGDLARVEVVGEASDGREAVTLVAQWRPDIVFLDVDMPGMSGLEALARIGEAQPGVRVVMLSMHDSEELVLAALKLGAAGFMLKDAAPEELAQAIRSVGQGGIWLSAAVSKAVISSYLERCGTGVALTLPMVGSGADDRLAVERGSATP